MFVHLISAFQSCGVHRGSLVAEEPCTFVRGKALHPLKPVLSLEKTLYLLCL